jgi:hypothetical protein
MSKFSLARVVVHEIFQRFPGVEQCDVVIVNHIAVLIPRILIVPGLKCKRSVNEVEIQIFEAESFQTRLESRFDALGPVIGVPQLRGDENVLARDRSTGECCLQRTANLALVPVSFRAIEVAESGVESVSGRSYRYGWVGNQSAEAQCGHAAGSVVERNSRHAQIGRLNHGYTSKSARLGFERTFQTVRLEASEVKLV